MAEKDLIWLKGKGDKHSDDIRAKAYKVGGTPARKMAQKISSIPKMNPDNREKKILELISNPEIAAEDIRKMIEKLKDMNLDTKEYMDLIKICLDWYAKRFGIVNKNLNLNVDVISDRVVQRLANWKGSGDYEKMINEKIEINKMMGGDKNANLEHNN